MNPVNRKSTALSTPVAAAILIAAGAGLSCSFPLPDQPWLVWPAMAAWAFALCAAKRSRLVHGLNYLFGFAFFAGNLYWLIGITIPGWLALSAYMGVYFWIAGLLVRHLYRTRGVPLALAMPIVWVSMEWIRGWALTGFGWFYLGHTQYQFLTLIQVSDLGGAYMVSFVIAMVAGLLAEMADQRLAGPTRSLRFMAIQTTVVVGLLASVMGYGLWRLTQKTCRVGPTLAIVQEKIPQHVKLSQRSNDEIVEKHLAISRKAMKQPSDMIVWPETMIPQWLRPESESPDVPFSLKRYPPENHAAIKTIFAQAWRYQQTVKAHARKANRFLLVGSSRFERDPSEPIGWAKSNAVFLYHPDGRQDLTFYEKTHLVPFGEYIPFRESWPWLHKKIIWLSPYDYDHSVTAGKGPAIFEFRPVGAKRIYRFGVPICYEDVVPAICREFVVDAHGRKQSDFLINVSNDGWFGNSSELIQHLTICVFRAVENRVGIARAVNTGVSGFIDPDGKIHDLIRDENGRLRGVTGFTVSQVVLDSRISYYSRLGDLFAAACIIATIALPLGLCIRNHLTR